MRLHKIKQRLDEKESSYTKEYYKNQYANENVAVELLTNLAIMHIDNESKEKIKEVERKLKTVGLTNGIKTLVVDMAKDYEDDYIIDSDIKARVISMIEKYKSRGNRLFPKLDFDNQKQAHIFKIKYYDGSHCFFEEVYRGNLKSVKTRATEVLNRQPKSRFGGQYSSRLFIDGMELYDEMVMLESRINNHRVDESVEDEEQWRELILLLSKRHRQLEFMTLEDAIDYCIGLTEVNLRLMGLKQLPNSIGKLSNLDMLFLDGNKLTSLPDTIGAIPSLRVLVLSNNSLQELPESIGNLSRLEVLVLHDNKLQELPESIGKLTSLRDLKLHRNKLQELPESIGNLTSLKNFYVQENELTILPKSIGKLTSLIRLYLGRNELIRLPETVGYLTSLRILVLPDNKLQELPESIGNLTALRDFYVQDNRLKYLPKSMGGLVKLDHLSLSDNPLDIKDPTTEWVVSKLKGYLRTFDLPRNIRETRNGKRKTLSKRITC